MFGVEPTLNCGTGGLRTIASEKTISTLSVTDQPAPEAKMPTIAMGGADPATNVRGARSCDAIEEFRKCEIAYTWLTCRESTSGLCGNAGKADCGVLLELNVCKCAERTTQTPAPNNEVVVSVRRDHVLLEERNDTIPAAAPTCHMSTMIGTIVNDDCTTSCVPW